VPAHGILVVDDEPSVIAIVGQMLKGVFNGPIFFASTAARAAELWQEHPIELLITDMTLGESSGDTLAANFIRSNPQGRVVIITGWEIDLTEVERTIGRRIPVLRKPFSPDELQQAISK
jgi:DNA-binding NtrC family response regulator